MRKSLRPLAVATAVIVALGIFTMPVHAQTTAGGRHVSTKSSTFSKRLLGTDWTSLRSQRKVVALTFDAGANADGIPSILRTLKAKGVPGTFFLTGQWVRSYPRYTKQIASRGYVLGNHTDTHPHVPQISDSSLREQLTSTETAVRTLTGRSTKPLFRFPFGDRRTSDIARVNSLGYVAVCWTVDTAGWLGTSGGQSSDTVMTRVLGGLKPGEIILMHVGSNPTDHSTLDADTLPAIIDELRSRGYGFTSMDALLHPNTATSVA